MIKINIIKTLRLRILSTKYNILYKFWYNYYMWVTNSSRVKSNGCNIFETKNGTVVYSWNKILSEICNELAVYKVANTQVLTKDSEGIILTLEDVKKYWSDDATEGFVDIETISMVEYIFENMIAVGSTKYLSNSEILKSLQIVYEKNIAEYKGT